jgi:hypothetical protein
MGSRFSGETASRRNLNPIAQDLARRGGEAGSTADLLLILLVETKEFPFSRCAAAT